MKNVVSGVHVVLRKLQEQDVPEYLSRLSLTIQQLLHISSLESERAYIENRMQQTASCMYAIRENLSGNLIGGLEIRPRPPFFGQLYVWINEQFWGTGYFQEAIMLSAAAYFQNTDDYFFTAHVDWANKRSYYALKKAGFADSGIGNGAHGKQYLLIYRRR